LILAVLAGTVVHQVDTTFPGRQRQDSQATGNGHEDEGVVTDEGDVTAITHEPNLTNGNIEKCGRRIQHHQRRDSVDATTTLKL
jgi:hypothetical protein